MIIPHITPLSGLSPGALGVVASVAESSHVDNSVSTTDAASYTFSSQSLGTAAADRRVVVAVSFSYGAYGAATVSSLTAGGQSGASVATVDNATSERTELWAAAVSSGTTGDVVVTPSGTVGNCGIGVFRVVGADFSAAHDTANSTADPASSTIDVPANGVLIAGACIRESGGTTWTWTGPTEAYDEVIESGEIGHSGANADYSTTQTGLTVTADSSATPVRNPIMVAASWGPSS